MDANSIHVKRTVTVLRPDQSRVLLRPFSPEDPQRAGRIIARIMSLPENRVGPLLDEVTAEFSQRHQQIHKSFLERFEQVRDLLLTDEKISEQRKLLIGSYFVLSSACARPGRDTSPPSLFGQVSSTPTIGSRSYPQPASSPSRVKSRTPVTRRRSSSGNSLSWD